MADETKSSQEDLLEEKLQQRRQERIRPPQRVGQQQLEQPPTRDSPRSTEIPRGSQRHNYSLQSVDEQYVLLLDAIDKLKLGSDVNLPEIVVLGDQSEGKSTVLEAIAGVKLPKGDRTCTKCLIRLCIRKKPNVHATIEFGGKTDDVKDQADFSTALKSIMDKNFPDQISMKEVIDIKISGPNRPNLTVVDAPGFKSDMSDNDENMEALRARLDNPNVVMVVVLKAINDIEASRGYGLAHELDPEFERTVFVLTHCDNLMENKQKMVSDMLKNRNAFAVNCYSENEYSPEEEKKFFDEAAFWRGQPQSNLGVDALISHLAENMFKILKPRREEIHSALLNLWRTEDKELLKLNEKKADADGEFKRLLVKLNKELEEHLSGTHRKKQNELYSDCKKKWSEFGQGLKNVASDFGKSNKLKEIVDEECAKQVGHEFDNLPNYFPVLKRVMKKHIISAVNPIIDKLIGDIECIIQSCIQTEVKRRLQDREPLENFVNTRVREHLPKLRRDVGEKIKMIMSMETAVYQQSIFEDDQEHKAPEADSSSIPNHEPGLLERLIRETAHKHLPDLNTVQTFMQELVQQLSGAASDPDEILRKTLCKVCHEYIRFVLNRIASSIPKAMIRFMLKRMSKDIWDCVSDDQLDEETKEQLKAKIVERIEHLKKSTKELQALLMKF